MIAVLAAKEGPGTQRLTDVWNIWQKCHHRKWKEILQEVWSHSNLEHNVVLLKPAPVESEVQLLWGTAWKLWQSTQQPSQGISEVKHLHQSDLHSLRSWKFQNDQMKWFISAALWTITLLPFVVAFTFLIIFMEKAQIYTEFIHL